MRTTIVDTAYHYACEHGLSSLSIRTIAKECSVSVGSIYNYFPDKAALVTEVILKFWTTIAFSEETQTCLNYREGESLITFCERLYSTMNTRSNNLETTGLVRYHHSMHEHVKRDVKRKTLVSSISITAWKKSLSRTNQSTNKSSPQ